MAWWLFRAVAPMIVRKGEGELAPPELRYPNGARLKAFLLGDWEDLWGDLESILAVEKRRPKAKADPTATANVSSHKHGVALCSTDS